MSGLPDVPQIQFRPQASFSTLEFWWQAPINNGGALIQNYTLLCSSIPYSTVIGPSSFYAKVPGLTNSQNYTFQLAATNTNGRGPYVAFTTAQPGIAPVGATSLAVEPLTKTTASATWNFTQNVNEGVNKYFVLTVIPSITTPQLSTFQVPIYPNQRSQLVSRLSSTTYTFLLQSINDAGYSFPNISTIQTISVPEPVILLSALSYSGTGQWLDESGNGNNATCSGTPAKNAGGNGILFNGTAFWSFPNVAAGNAWTVGVWVKNINMNAGYILTQNSNANLNLVVGQADTNTLTVGFYNGSWRIGQSVPQSNSNGVWLCIQGTWDGTTLTTYFNGVSAGTSTPGVASLDPNAIYYIGKRNNGAQIMSGQVGEVRIYRSALTANQIRNDYNSSAPNFTY